jgi:hypothetical protein
LLALTKRFDDEHEGEEADEEGVKFLESGEHATVAFEPSEEAFDLIALGVEGKATASELSGAGLEPTSWVDSAMPEVTHRLLESSDSYSPRLHCCF